MFTQFNSFNPRWLGVARFRNFLRRHSLVISILLMFGVTWPVMLAGSGLLPFQFPFLLSLMTGWGLALASLVMTGLALGKAGFLDLLKRFLVWRIELRWYGIALLLLPGLQLLSIFLTWAISPASVDFSSIVARSILGESSPLLLLALPWFLYEVITNGEELAWRGYVLPRLQSRYNALFSSLVIGLLWSIWHLPYFLGTGSSTGRSFLWFTLAHLALAVLYTWLYNNTGGSLLLVTLFHASGNTAGMFLPVTFAVRGGLLSNLMILLYLLAALLITLYWGPWRLSETAPKQVQE